MSEEQTPQGEKKSYPWLATYYVSYANRADAPEFPGKELGHTLALFTTRYNPETKRSFHIPNTELPIETVVKVWIALKNKQAYLNKMDKKSIAARKAAKETEEATKALREAGLLDSNDDSVATLTDAQADAITAKVNKVLAPKEAVDDVDFE